MRRLRGMVVMVVAGAVGCSAPFVEYRPGGGVGVRAAMTNETMTLYREGWRVESTTVGVGEVVGFVRREGKLFAVDGTREVPLEEGRYAWVVEVPEKVWWPEGSGAGRLDTTPATGNEAAARIACAVATQAVADRVHGSGE